VSTTHLFWTSILAWAAAGIASLGARALRNFSRHDLEEIANHRGQPERFNQVLRRHETIALAVEMLAGLNTALAIVASSGWAAQRWGTSSNLTSGLTWSSDWSELLAISACLGLILAVVTIWLPWTLSRLSAEGFVYHAWPLWKVLAGLTAPLVGGAKLVDLALHRIAGRTLQNVDEETVEEEIRAIVSEGHHGRLLEEDAREMIEGVMELGDADVSEIMTPRTDMHMLSVAMLWDEMVADVIEAGYTRIPVYEANRDEIIGILYSKDLLPELATGDPGSRTPIRELLRKPVFVPETKPIDDLLQMFQQLRTHIAVVLDEYGGVSGLVTIEDVLEEIVGEIVDEYDEEVEQELKQLDDGAYEALGRTHVDVINQRMKLNLPDDGDFDTIGGFVFTELGRVPLVGESLVWQDQVRIDVVEASKRRIQRVRIERLNSGVAAG